MVSWKGLLSQRLGQQFSGPAEPVLHQGQADAQDLGGLPLLALLEQAEDGHDLDLLRQGPEGGFQVQAGVPVGGRGLLLGQVLQGELLPAAEVVPAEVAGDDVEIVGRLAIVAVPVQGGEEPGEGLLGDVLPVLAVAEMVAAVPQDLGVVLSDEGLDGLVVPLVHPADQAGIWVHGSSLLSERWNRAFHPV